MPNKLSSLSWDQLKDELSISGNREKIILAAKTMEQTLSSAVDLTNPGDIINADLVVKRLLAEVQTWKRIYKQRTGQTI